MPRRNCFHHTFRGRRYRVCENVPLRTHYGSTDDPTTRGKTIKLKAGQEPLEELDTILHESIHANYWDLEESAVHQGATDLARLLWRLGYRRLTPDQLRELDE